MTIQFILKQDVQTEFTYSDVACDQFFIKDGCLCQKHTSEKFVRITNDIGRPYCMVLNIDADTPIDYPLPEFERIEY